MTDLEQRLRDAMTVSVAEARPAFGVADIRRRHRGHQWLVAVVSVGAAVAVLLAALAVRGSLSGHGAPAPVSPGRTSRYVDPSSGWRISYPRGWVLGHVSYHGLGTVQGTRVSSFAPDLPAGDHSFAQLGWLRAFPANGVAAQVWSSIVAGSPPPGPPLQDSAFPLRPVTFKQVRPFEGGGEPRPFVRTFYGDGYGFVAAVWLGSHASQASRQAAWAVVRSLRFRALRTGTTWRGAFYVLGPASGYPVGSVTFFLSTSLPGGLGPPTSFYLVHAPRGFYTVGVVPSSPSVNCLLKFDQQTRQFFCPGQRWRWDLRGQPVGVPPPAVNPNDKGLVLQDATVAQDGHVIFEPGFYTSSVGPFWG